MCFIFMKKVNFLFLILILVMVATSAFLYLTYNDRDGVVLGEMNMAATTGIALENITTDTLKVGQVATLKGKITNSTASEFAVSVVQFKILKNDPEPDIFLCQASTSGKSKVAAGGTQEYSCPWTPTASIPVDSESKIEITFRSYNDTNDDWVTNKYLLDKTAAPVGSTGGVLIENVTTDSLMVGKEATLKAKISNNSTADFVASSIIFKIPQPGDDLQLCKPSLNSGNRTVSKGTTMEYACTWTPLAAQVGAQTTRLRINYNDNYTIDKDFTVLPSGSGDGGSVVKEVKVENITANSLKVGQEATLKVKITNTTDNNFDAGLVQFYSGTELLCSYTENVDANMVVAKNGGTKELYCKWTPTVAGQITMIAKINDDNSYKDTDIFTVAPAGSSAGTVLIENITTDTLKVGQAATLKARITNTTASDFTVSKVQFKIQQTDPTPDIILCPTVSISGKTVVAKNGGVQEYSCTWTPTVDTPLVAINSEAVRMAVLLNNKKVEITLRVNNDDKYTVVNKFDFDSTPGQSGSRSQLQSLAPGLDRSTISAAVALLKDSDSDKLDDIEEGWWNTDINKADTDGDSYSDYTEITNCYNPLAADGKKINCGTKIYNKMQMAKLSFAQGQKQITLQKELKNKLIDLIGTTKTNQAVNNVTNWPKLYKAYIYGRYVAEEIADTIINGPCLVHPTIPALEWRQSQNYKSCF